jgi:DNA (cytosine-5)-methyltransferase 1
MKVLNLRAGVGGNRKLWTGVQVTAIEKVPKIAEVYKRLYPDDEVIVTDANEYLETHYSEFDFIWDSPSCQKESRMVKFTRHKRKQLPSLEVYRTAIFLQNFFKGKWVVENVVPYYEPLIKPMVRCGRHLFWSNFKIDPLEIKQPKNTINLANVAGKKVMMDWLGIHFDENIYYEGNHCPAQVLRNCVHPELGLHVFNEMLKSFENKHEFNFVY